MLLAQRGGTTITQLLILLAYLKALVFVSRQPGKAQTL